jgi:DNA-binding CsgD family transcriptional regulator
MNNNRAIDYNRQIVVQLQDVCSSLFRVSCIKSFRYFKVFNDNTYFNLSTNHEWLCDRVSKIPNNGRLFHTALCAANKDKPTFYLWENNVNDPVCNLFIKHNIANGISIYYRHDDFIEAWSFGATKDDNQAYNFYINNLDLFKKFIFHFNKVAGNIIDTSDHSILARFDDNVSIIPAITLPQIPAQLPSINASQVSKSCYSLTKKEIECLRLLSIGKTTAKAIAKVLDISPRTVEHHIESIKIKLDIYNKNDLADYFWNNLYCAHNNQIFIQLEDNK